MKPTPTAHLLHRLRHLMAEQGIDAYYVPSSDPHMSEMPPARWKRRAYISGFTGSAGTVVVTANEALLWTDGRYFLQAEQQLQAPDWTLMKSGIPEVPTVEKWLVTNLKKAAVVAFDPWTMSVEEYKKMKESLTARKRSALQLQPTEDLIDLIWAEDTERPMPALPTGSVFIHPVEYAGQTVSEKLQKLAEDMKTQKVTHILLTALDDVAWVLNLRGSDTEYSPIFIAYCIARVDASAILFIDEHKLTEAVRAHLNEANVTTRPYEAISEALSGETREDAEFSFDASQCNLKLYNSLDTNPLVESSPRTSLVTLAKAAKNEREIQGMKDCHVRDAAALIRYFKWLEDRMKEGTQVTECSGAAKLAEFRSQLLHFQGLSFETISSVGPNAAIIHYTPSAETDATITSDSMYLVDSGGQYLDGTTDVTRTMHFAQPTAKQIECFTRVLKGHLALRLAIIPNTCSGHQLDSWARAALWKAGLEYRHGTGHGVGSYLNVHEGPHLISQRPNAAKMLAGYIVSNEPGYYEDGEFGIRIENLCFFKEAATKYSVKGMTFLELEDLTMVPIQAKLVDVNLLTDVELNALNEYHRQVLDRVGPLVKDEPEVLQWLESACRPLGRFLSC